MDFNLFEKAQAMMSEALEQARVENEVISSISKLYFAIFRIDLTTNLYEEISADSEVHRLTGTSGNAAEKMLELCDSFVVPEYQESVSEFFNLSTLPGRLADIETVEMEYPSKAGQWHQARFIAKKRTESGEVTHVLYVTRDVSAEKHRELEQRRALKDAFEAAEQASSAKTAFLNSMSHDIRTPMNGIIGMTAIASAHLNDIERVKECLDKISSASNHLLALINEVLDVSRIESGRMSLAEEEFELSDHLDSLVIMVAPQAKAKSQKLTVTVSDMIHEKVIGDPAKLQQVFVNIVGNAVKYTPTGGTISVNLRELPSTNVGYSKYQFTCADNGIGMRSADLEKLFVAFERAEDDDVRKVQGTGLGMAITQGIVRMMDGDIKVDSEYHKGSTFTVTFSLKRQWEDTAEYRLLRGVPTLVIDGDEANRANTLRLLREMGTKEAGASSIQEVRNLIIEKGPFRGCLVDWDAAPEGGLETLKAARELLGDGAHIFVSSLEDLSERAMEIHAAGADGFLTKPLFKSKILAAVSQTAGERPSLNAGDKLASFAEKDYSDKRILLVEDNELNLEIAAEIVGMTGAQVETAMNGAEALENFESSPVGYYDMILTDIQMPVMDGHKAARAVRALGRPDAKCVPIVAMSANAFVEDRESSLSSGMNDHIAKPIDLEKLMGVMEKHLGTRSKRPNGLSGDDKKSDFVPARYYEELYLANGSTAITEETQRACLEVLEKNGATGIFGILEQRDYPIYCVSGFALSSLGYTYKELMEECDGSFINLVHADDRKRLVAEFYEKGYKHQYRMVTKGGLTILVTSFITDTFVMDGSKARMLSLRVEDGGDLRENGLIKNAAWKNRIIGSLAKSALYMYELDVTTGLVGSDIVGENGTNYTKVLGIDTPCLFDELIQRSLVSNLRSSLQSVDGLKSLNCKNLLDAYENGETCPEVELFYTKDQEYHRLTYYMSRDIQSGHVIALVVCHDITDLKR